MDSNVLVAVIAVSGTLAGAIVSAISTYFIQGIRYKKDIDWEREKSRTQYRREQISNRVAVIEETATLMKFLTGIRMDKEYGEGVYCDDITFATKDARIEEIYSEAYTFSKALGSRDIDEAFSSLSNKYWEIHSENIDVEDYEVISTNFRKLIEAIDELKINA